MTKSSHKVEKVDNIIKRLDYLAKNEIMIGIKIKLEKVQLISDHFLKLKA